MKHHCNCFDIPASLLHREEHRCGGQVYRCGGIMQLLHMTIDRKRQLEEIRHLVAREILRICLSEQFWQLTRLTKKLSASAWRKIFIRRHLLHPLLAKKT